jgi:hypothetical protein
MTYRIRVRLAIVQSIIASIMQTRPIKILMWQLINEEREN